ncbi:MAG: LysR family transcriptional regulator [Qingshengfaniella sp.]
MIWDSRSLSVFLASAQTGSFGRAARQLNMNQPTVTRIIRRMEDRFGVPLFDRTPTGVAPNVYGQAFLPYANLVLAEIENAGQVIDSLRGASVGIVRVGGVGSLASGHLATALHRMLITRPALQAQIVEAIEDKLLEALKRGEVDLAISPEPYFDPEITLACTEILHDEIGAFAAPDHPLAGCAEISLEAAARHPWVLPTDETPLTREWQRRFFSRGLDPRPAAAASRSVNMLKQLATLGGLICWMPSGLVHHEVAQTRLVRLDIPDLAWAREFRIYRRRNGQLPPAAHVLLKELQDIIHADPEKNPGIIHQ